MVDLKSLLDYAASLGVRETELYLEESNTWGCRVYQGEVENLQASQGRGLGVRVIVDKALGIAYTSDVSEESAREAISRAAENARISAPDELRCFYAPEGEYPTIDAWSQDIEDTPAETKIRMALDMEAMAKRKNERIQKVLGTSVGTRSHSVTVVNSKGVNVSFKSNSATISCQVLAAENGVMQPGSGAQFSRSFSGLNPEKVVDEAVQKALNLLGGKPVESQDASVIFCPEVSAIIWQMLASTLTGEAVQKKRSMFAGMLGQKVASELVSLIDDPFNVDGYGASPFDAEGVPRKRMALIEDGVLKAFMYDCYSAAKDGVKSTGHASRRVQSAVQVAPCNLYLKPGTLTLEEVVASTKNGFLVMDVSGITVGGLNPVSGDLSVGASGRWITGGKFVGPVREVTIAGNLKDILLGIDAVASDLKWTNIGTPSFRTAKMAVSGK
ncbi:MAG TPA: TldD/PmbA family protein [Firmicutes bacterium]|nr:TldD/PmbA family protein [Candidatus Fermentithermobacillaceae bacterium]